MLFLIGLCFLATSGYVIGECSNGCKEPTLFYDGLKCKPVFASPGDCCPSKYDCSHIEARAAANEEKCYFQGKAYNPGEEVDNDEIYGNCQFYCTCTKYSEKMGFRCGILDCPEYGPALKYEFNTIKCHHKYELGKCCANGDACPPYNATCEVGGKTYHEGNKFNAPNKTCTECVCQEGFDGQFEEPFCRKGKCVEEVTRQNEIHNFCAPSFISLDDCCPYNWKCPENGDKIVPAATPSDLKCKYGEQILNIGDKFERISGEKGKLSCECRIPPYLTCIQNYFYPVNAPDYY